MCPLASARPCQNIYIVGENVMPIIPANPSSGALPRRRNEAAGGRGLMAPCPLAMAVLLEQEQEGSLRSSQEALIKGSPEGALLKGAHIPTIVMVALS
ncbi:hypothetical protein ROHU_019778 [Labeo rohita]|uniref:Uncharacterized protein n=1 Tax=Labeo rohita TaxID=84645 RepID=A0A498N0F9_LABRO|nr:hypothetical protein ROHU_019778 [Labeo rohita]